MRRVPTWGIAAGAMIIAVAMVTHLVSRRERQVPTQDPPPRMPAQNAEKEAHASGTSRDVAERAPGPGPSGDRVAVTIDDLGPIDREGLAQIQRTLAAVVSGFEASLMQDAQRMGATSHEYRLKEADYRHEIELRRAASRAIERGVYWTFDAEAKVPLPDYRDDVAVLRLQPTLTINGRKAYLHVPVFYEDEPAVLAALQNYESVRGVMGREVGLFNSLPLEERQRRVSEYKVALSTYKDLSAKQDLSKAERRQLDASRLTVRLWGLRLKSMQLDEGRLVMTTR